MPNGNLNKGFDTSNLRVDTRTEICYHKCRIMSNARCTPKHTKMKTTFIRFTLIVFLSISGLEGSVYADVNDAQRAYQAGMQALTSAQAFAEFQRAIALEPSFAAAHYQLGLLYGRQSQWKPAVQAFQTAIEIDADFVDAHCRLGEAYLIGLAQARAAIPPLRRALQLQPDLERARRLLGTAYLRQNRLDDAIHHLKQTSDTESRYLLGLTYFQRGDFLQAIPHFEAVIQREKRHAKAHFNLGNCYLRTGKIAKGRNALRTFEKLTREEEQLARLRRAIRDSPQRLAFRYQLAELLIKRAEWDAAIGELKACVAVAPHDEKGYELLGYIYLQTEAYTEAREVYGHLVETRPESAVYRNSLGVVYMMLEKPRQAIVQFETAARLAPNNPQVYRNLAKAYRQIGEQEKAAKAYQRYRDAISRSRNETHREHP